MKKTSQYKEKMYRKGYELYQQGLALKTQSRQIFRETGTVPAQLVESASECFRKSNVLANAARRAEG